MSVAQTLVAAMWLWLEIGAAVALAFLTLGIGRIDADARGAYMFRPLLAPGVMLIWPLVLWRWLALETGRDGWARRHRPPRAAHFAVAVAMALLIPALLIAGIALRRTWPADAAPVRLSAPAEAGQ